MRKFGESVCLYPDCTKTPVKWQSTQKSMFFCAEHLPALEEQIAAGMHSQPVVPKGSLIERLFIDFLLAVLIAFSLTFTVGAWAIGVYQLLEWIFT